MERPGILLEGFSYQGKRQLPRAGLGGIDGARRAQCDDVKDIPDRLFRPVLGLTLERVGLLALLFLDLLSGAVLGACLEVLAQLVACCLDESFALAKVEID